MRTANGKVIRSVWLALIAGMFASLGAGRAIAQPAAPQPWSGWAQCRVDIQGPGYTSQYTHTWTMTGGAPTAQGAFLMHPATWSVTGSGSLQRSQGAQTLAAQWTTNVQGVSGPIAVVVRASDGQLLIRAGHAQLRQRNGIVGTQVVMIDGKPSSSAPFGAEAFEWAFPNVEDMSRAPRITGSRSAEVPGSHGVMQPAGSRTIAACTWDFARAGSASAPAPAPAPAVTMPGMPGGTTTPASSNPGTANPGAANPGSTNPGATNPAGQPAPPTMTVVPITPVLTPTPTTTTPPPPPTMTVVPLLPQVINMPPPTAPSTGGETPIPGSAKAPAVEAAPPDAYEPNNSESEAKSIGELKMRAPALVIEGTFDTSADVDDWYVVRITDDGSPPDANVLKHTDHHLTAAFTNPAYALGDYPLYKITVRATTGFLAWRDSETQMSPTVTVPWPKTKADDSQTFVIRIHRTSGQPNSNKYRLVLQAD